MLVGYILAGAEEASDRSGQRYALQRAGCRDIVEESASADGKEQPELGRLLGRLNRRDVVVVARLGALGLSLEDASPYRPTTAFIATHAARGMASIAPANSWKCVANGV